MIRFLSNTFYTILSLFLGSGGIALGWYTLGHQSSAAFELGIGICVITIIFFSFVINEIWTEKRD